MRILVTGATGFIGRYVVAEALNRGHEVIALVRPAAAVDDLQWHTHPSLSLLRADLRAPRGLEAGLRDADTVVHLAAALSGDFYDRFAATVIATEQLLAAMDRASVRHLVGISSFAVYDYLRLRSWSVLDESSPLETQPEHRHVYAHTKLIQERLMREHAQQRGWRWTILRPGSVYGRDSLWVARLGIQRGPLWLRLGAWAPVGLIYVENCADAIVSAVERREADGRVLNLVDDDCPSQRRYMREIRTLTHPRPRIVPVGWTLLRITARLVWVANRLLFREAARLPGIVVPASLHSIAKPLRYSNAAAKQVLEWRPRFDRRTALARATDEALPLPELKQADPVAPALAPRGMEIPRGVQRLSSLAAFAAASTVEAFDLIAVAFVRAISP